MCQYVRVKFHGAPVLSPLSGFTLGTKPNLFSQKTKLNAKIHAQMLWFCRCISFLLGRYCIWVIIFIRVPGNFGVPFTNV